MLKTPEALWASLPALACGLLLLFFSGRMWRWIDSKTTEGYPRRLSQPMPGAYDENMKGIRSWRLLEVYIWISRVIGAGLLFVGVLFLYALFY